MKKGKKIQSMYQKMVWRQAYWFTIDRQNPYSFKDFNTFMYDHTLSPGRKHFCCYCLWAFTAEETKCHIEDCFKLVASKRL